MKKQNTSFFASLFGAKGKAPVEQTTTAVVLTAFSQPHVLRQRMLEEKMTHGESITANLSPVRLEKNFGNDAVLYFCPMKSIEVLHRRADGDGGRLPVNATLEGLSVPEDYAPGLYRLRHVVLTSNGTMQVRAIGETVWEKIGD